jgi:uncharacterized protein
MTYLNLFDPKLIRDSTPLTRVFFIIFIAFSSFLILGFIFIVLAIPLFNLSMAEINNLLKGNLTYDNILFIKYFQASQSVALFVVPAIILNYILFAKNNNFILTGKTPSFRLLFLIFLLMIFLIPIIDILMQWNEMIRFPVAIENRFHQLENEASDLTEKLLSGKSFSDLMINIFVIAIIPAIGEEFLFRGVLQRLFYDWLKNGQFAIIVGAILFSGIHLQFYGFIPRMILGILFGYLFYWSNNIWLPVIGHFLNNFITVIMQFINSNEIVNLQNFSFGLTQNGVMLLIITIVLASLLIFIIRKTCLTRFAEEHS